MIFHLMCGSGRKGDRSQMPSRSEPPSAAKRRTKRPPISFYAFPSTRFQSIVILRGWPSIRKRSERTRGSGLAAATFGACVCSARLFEIGHQLFSGRLFLM